MITASDLVHLGQLYAPGPVGHPSYVVTGGSAVLCWLNDFYHRQHNDIDLLLFSRDSIPLPQSNDNSPYLLGSLGPSGITSERSHPIVEVQRLRGCYYDSEIIPQYEDVRIIDLNGTKLPVLSLEFIVVSKLTYPNVHRAVDFADVLAINRSGLLNDADYLERLLNQTSLGKLIESVQIREANTDESLAALLNHIHYLLVRQFLHWPLLHVEVLDTFSCFVLLDIMDELMTIPSDKEALLSTSFTRFALSRQDKQLAILGYCFLAPVLSYETLKFVLRGAYLEDIVGRFLPHHRAQYLSRLKRLSTILRAMRQIEHHFGTKLDEIWRPDLIAALIKSAFDDGYRTFALLVAIKALHADISDKRWSLSVAAIKLNELLVNRKSE